MSLGDRRKLEIAYTLLPPPLASLPAKYHAPISLLLHSLSTGWVASSLTELINPGSEEESVVSFLLGVTHDIHQKLVKDGLTSPRKAKAYIKRKFDELGLNEYYRYVDYALDVDACGKEVPVKGLPVELVKMCHIGDMMQGRLTGYSLLYWLRKKLGELTDDVGVFFYSVMIPQPFARSYIMNRIYHRVISKEAPDNLTLTSPWGLYVIAGKDDLEHTLEISWDILRVCSDNPDDGEMILFDYKDIVKFEKNKKVDKKNVAISISGDELKYRVWSRFARMFYCESDLNGRNAAKIYPVLDKSLEGLFINIRFTDVEFTKIPKDRTYVCGLCGVPHLAEQSFPLTVYGTKQNAKLSPLNPAVEKWNRFIPAHLKVKTSDTKGTWYHGIGMCPLCTLDAFASRKVLSRARGKGGFVILSLSKPTPLELVSYIAKMMESTLSGRRIDVSGLAEKPEVMMGRKLVIDMATATIIEPTSKPDTSSLFAQGRYGLLTALGELIVHGLYPLKYVEQIDTSVIDRMVTLPVTFALTDFPVTSRKYGKYVPWVASLLSLMGKHKKTEMMRYVDVPPETAPLLLLSLNKGVYSEVSSKLAVLGWS